MRTKGAVELLLDGHAGVLHIGVAIAEQEGLVAGALRGGGLSLSWLGLECRHHKQGDQQLHSEDGIDRERHGMGGFVPSASVVSLMNISLS